MILPILPAFHFSIFIFVLNFSLSCTSPEGRLYPSSNCLLLFGDNNPQINPEDKSQPVNHIVSCIGKKS